MMLQNDLAADNASGKLPMMTSESPRSCMYPLERLPCSAVRFAPENMLVQSIAPTTKLSKDVKSRLWYSKDEFWIIKKSQYFTLRTMESKSGPIEDEEMCSRGLESRTKPGAIRKRRNIESSWDTVLDEQERQWKENRVNEIALAEVYRSTSAQCAMAAYLRGLADAEFVHGMRKESTPTCLKSTQHLTTKAESSQRRRNLLATQPRCLLAHCLSSAEG